MMNTTTDFFEEVIYAYTRAQAIEDGELVDVSDMAKQSGFKIPVAVTRTVILIHFSRDLKEKLWYNFAK